MPRPRMTAEVKARLVKQGSGNGSPPSRGSARELVVDAVHQWIFDGVLRDGDVISQEDLADVLGVSRIPVRDGLITLAGAGWVVMEPDKGARAVGLDAAAVRDSFELFAGIWSLLIRRAVERGGDTTALIQAGRQVAAAESPSDVHAANDLFIARLRELAAAPRLDAAFASASRIVPGNFFEIVPDSIAVQRRHIPRIGVAIGRGDVDKATALTVSQHRAHAANIVELLVARGVLPPRATARR